MTAQKINQSIPTASLLVNIHMCIDFYVMTRDIHTYRALQTIQMKLRLLCVWAEPAVFGSAKTALKFKYEI